MPVSMSNIASCVIEHIDSGLSERSISVIDHSRSCTWRDLCSRVQAISAALRSTSYGISKGDRVAFLSRNSLHFLEAILATVYTGAIAVPINTRWTKQEVDSGLRACRPKLVFCEPSLFLQLGGEEQGYKIIFLGITVPEVGKMQSYTQCQSVQASEEIVRKYTGYNWVKPGAKGEDVAMIVFTSGTTGNAKGACLSHHALSFQAHAKLQSHNYSCNDVYLQTVSLAHVGGLVSMLAMLQAGATLVMLPQFSAQAVASLSKHHAVTALIAVPAMIADLNCSALPTVKKILLGGGELPVALVSPLLQIFPSAAIWTAYGMTECASSITVSLLNTNKQNSLQPGSRVGRAPPGISMAIYNVDKAENCEEGLGEVITRGPHVMSGYWKDQRATEEAFLPGGWFRTGDLGWLDKQGELWLAGRLKDLIRSGSESVAPAEVERVLLQHSSVLQAAVVGLPDTRLGEQVAAALQVRVPGKLMYGDGPGGHPNSDQVTDADLIQFCRVQGLAGFKIPRRIHLQVESLPMNASGKILKQNVKEILSRDMMRSASRL